MSLTSKDFTITGVTCPFCDRPAKLYERNGGATLRCTWEDCPSLRNMCVPSMEAFYRAIELDEQKTVVREIQRAVQILEAQT